MITRDEIIEETKNISTKTVPTKTILAKNTSTNFYILIAFLLITIALLVTVSIRLIKLEQNKNIYCHIMPQITY